jgi:hypothetical protein
VDRWRQQGDVFLGSTAGLPPSYKEAKKIFVMSIHGAVQVS